MSDTRTARERAEDLAILSYPMVEKPNKKTFIRGFMEATRTYWIDALAENTQAAILAIDEGEYDQARYWMERNAQYLTGDVRRIEGDRP